MKKYWYTFLAFILVITICGCSKDDSVDPNPPVVEPKEYYFTDLRCEFLEIRPGDRFGPTSAQICIICANENIPRMGIEITLTTLTAAPLYLYNSDAESVTTAPISWGHISGITDAGESAAVAAIVPQVGEFDFVLTTTQPQGYIPGFEDPVIIHESTPPLHLKMWQEGDDWKAELTTRNNENHDRDSSRSFPYAGAIDSNA